MAGSHLRTQRRVDRRVVIVVIVSLVVGLVVGACITWFLSDDIDLVAPLEQDAAGADAPPDRPAADPAEEPVADPTAAAAVPDPGPITLAFAGDIYAELSLADRLAADHDGFVGPFAEVLRGADLAVGNLEAAITTRGSPVDKEFTFRVPPGILDALRAGGFDVLSAANNHGLDYGASGLEETLAVKRAQPDGLLVGIGRDEDEAFAPYTAEVGGHRVAVIAATQVIDGHLIGSWTATADRAGLASAKRVDRLVEEVRRVRHDADTVVVYLHWGTETEVCPNSSQQELAGVLADAGADVIVGGHAHRLQGAGRLGDAFVGYGLGNFLFGAVSPAGAATGVLLVEVDGRDVLGYEWRPGRIVDRVPQPVTGSEAEGAVAEWDALRDCTGLTP